MSHLSLSEGSLRAHPFWPLCALNAAADFYLTVKAALHHKCVDSEG